MAASHVLSLNVPCAEEWNPRSGRRPAKVIKFTLGLLIGVQEAEQVYPKFTCQFAYSSKKFTLLPKCLHQRI